MENLENKDNKKSSDFLRSNSLNLILKVILIAIIVLAIFQAGIFVGYRKAEFSGQWGNNYSMMFGRPERGMPGMFEAGFTSGHGVAGKIIKIALPTLIIEGTDKVEKIVLVDNEVPIRKFREILKPADLKVDDAVVIIGTPDSKGQINAKLIRLMPTPDDNDPFATTSTAKPIR